MYVCTTFGGHIIQANMSNQSQFVSTQHSLLYAWRNQVALKVAQISRQGALLASAGPQEPGGRGQSPQPLPQILVDQVTLFQPETGHVMPSTLLTPPPFRIFRPSYGPGEATTALHHACFIVVTIATIPKSLP